MTFNREEYSKRADEIRLTNAQRLSLVDNMRRENSSRVISRPKRIFCTRGKKLLTRSLAAALALVVLGAGALTYIHYNPKNSFALSANAAEFRLDGTEVKIASGEAGGSPIYYEKKDKRNWVRDFKITDFEIQGNNIDEVSFSLGDKGAIFQTLPDRNKLPVYDVNRESDDSYLLWWDEQYAKALDESYIRREKPTNSYYKNVGEAHNSDENLFCNGFTVKNESADGISLNNNVSIVFEPDRSDEKTDALVEKFFNAYDKMEELEKQEHEKWVASGSPDVALTPTEEMKALEKELDKLDEEITEKVTRDKKMTVTVKYRDGQQESCTLRFTGKPEKKNGELVSFLYAEVV